MKTVILCGGRGTRLREETEFRPKPLLPIGNRPILWHIMRHYARFGHKDFILCLGYRGDLIKEWFRNYQWHTHDVSLCLGRPDSLRFLGTEEGTDWNVFLTYGDGVGNVDLAALLKQHQGSRAVCTVTAVHPPGRFGEIRLGSAGLIEAFNEKPQTEEGCINGGFMVCEPALFDYLPTDRPTMLEEAPMRRLAADGRLAAYRHEGFWQPMDTYQEYTLLNRLWAEGKAPWLA
jgi:glucose-1-phosphate cytidylyltransferase